MIVHRKLAKPPSPPPDSWLHPGNWQQAGTRGGAWHRHHVCGVQARGLMMSAGHSNRSICTTNECWFQLSLINVWLECCYAARLIISDCTLSCLCLMVEEQITEGSLSGSWWPAPVTDWDQWSWQRRASGGTLHNRQQEPPHRAHRATPSHRRHYRVTQSPQSLLLTLLSSQCLIVSPLAWN